MKNDLKLLSPVRINRLRAQGYVHESVEELSQMAFGIRFAYRSCVAIVVTATLTQSTILFSAMMVIAFFGAVLPNHPFDYVYNALLARPMNRPKLPRRAAQLTFACAMATTWLAGIVYFMQAGQTGIATIMGWKLAFIASLPSTIDLCVPSVLYNAMFHGQKAKAGAEHP